MSRQALNRQNSYDVLVVGARCAGASTAMLLARQGLRVLVVDRSREGSDTLSTHALMRGAVLQLAHWGLLDALIAAGTPAIRTTSFYYGDQVFEVPIKARNGVPSLFAPRRTVLDPILVEGARQAGAEFRFGVSVVGLTRSNRGRVDGVLLRGAGETIEVKAGLVVGADGVRSKIARLVDAPSYRKASFASANIYGYWSGLDVAGNHWYYRPEVAVGAIPTNDELTCIFASVPPDRFREFNSDQNAAYRAILRQGSPELDEPLSRGKLASGLRSFPGLPGYLRQSWGPGWALVGDAGYFRDPLTAHGITDALRDAELLARAILAGSPRALGDYQEQRDDLALGFFETTDQVASFQWDLGQVQEFHMAMSRQMNRECDALAELHREEIRKIA